jgi:hypothetical protein
MERRIAQIQDAATLFLENDRAVSARNAAIEALARRLSDTVSLEQPHR